MLQCQMAAYLKPLQRQALSTAMKFEKAQQNLTLKMRKREGKEEGRVGGRYSDFIRGLTVKGASL